MRIGHEHLRHAQVLRFTVLTNSFLGLAPCRRGLDAFNGRRYWPNSSLMLSMRCLLPGCDVERSVARACVLESNLLESIGHYWLADEICEYVAIRVVHVGEGLRMTRRNQTHDEKPTNRCKHEPTSRWGTDDRKHTETNTTKLTPRYGTK